MPKEDLEHLETEETQPEVAAEEPNEYKELWLRAQAELENMRKRFETEKQNLLRYGQEELISQLLPVLDNFDRATQHVPEDQQKSSWVMGIQYIQKNLQDVLENSGAVTLEAKVGDAFDAHKHEALGTEEVDGPEDMIVKIVNKGYKLGERLLRPVQVIVSKHPEKK